MDPARPRKPNARLARQPRLSPAGVAYRGRVRLLFKARKARIKRQRRIYAETFILPAKVKRGRAVIVGENSLGTAYADLGAEGLLGVTMDINSLAAVPQSVAAAPIPPELAPNAAVLVSPTAHAPDNNLSADTPWLQQKSADQRSMKEAIEELNSQLWGWSVQLQFEIDQETNQVVALLVDAATGKVVRSVPSEAQLRIAKMIIKFQGQAVNTTA